MTSRMSLSTRKEMISTVREKYQKSSWKEKSKILDGFIAATGYQRKYAILLSDNWDCRSTTIIFAGK